MSKNIFREVLKKIAKPKANKKVISFQNTTINKVESNKKTIENISWTTDKEKRKYRTSWANKIN